ncbi:MAG: hypothetical protein LBC41_18270 [Clostridiales bacterium]|jgi:hypothetical protein|nr:hypothetical protein [Clostridiales bacterium]MDR2752605.1 hypothetical protein [Clostridiales bacterium]
MSLLAQRAGVGALECYAAARKLGEMLLATEESLRLADAEASFQDPESSNGQEAQANLDAARQDFVRLASQVADLVAFTALGEPAGGQGCQGCSGCKR